MTNENNTSLHEKVLEDIEEAAEEIESRFHHGDQTDKNIAEFQEKLDERKASKEEKDWMEELDQRTLAFLVVEIALLTYLILGLIGIVPLF